MPDRYAAAYDELRKAYTAAYLAEATNTPLPLNATPEAIAGSCAKVKSAYAASQSPFFEQKQDFEHGNNVSPPLTPTQVPLTPRKAFGLGS